MPSPELHRSEERSLKIIGIDLHRWFEQRRQASQWPPATTQGPLPLDDD